MPTFYVMRIESDQGDDEGRRFESLPELVDAVIEASPELASFGVVNTERKEIARAVEAGEEYTIMSGRRTLRAKRMKA